MSSGPDKAAKATAGKPRRKKQGKKAEQIPWVPSAKPGHCSVCGKETKSKGTVYVGRQFREGSAIRTEWHEYELGICDDCVDERRQSERLMPAVYLVLQICWIAPATHGLSPIGIVGAAIAAYSVFKLVQAVADLVWRHRHHAASDDEEPPWMRWRTSREELASECLKEVVSKRVGADGYLVESIAEHERNYGTSASNS
jgi:hypothetical protein